MDFPPIISQIWGMPNWIFPGAFFLARLKRPRSQGYPGELSVRLLARKPGKHTYLQLHNLTLNTLGSTTQIHRFVGEVWPWQLPTITKRKNLGYKNASS
ncbi:NERD domain-containing protein [Pseudomonas syringae pv. actinidifoliorum]|nr:NERD domain-containing protein [Pseudomonas syringae pv. actinidifoliorum]MDU8523821.1 NERD domain-containing protein [Pseudomonas syringae pv. actinidifoliorum]MDU8529745.1 NERD domain-containing protein [Pseudomonas syringae pv. actinidifoliorum]